jgi:hypothetical protein
METLNLPISVQCCASSHLNSMRYCLHMRPSLIYCASAIISKTWNVDNLRKGHVRLHWVPFPRLFRDASSIFDMSPKSIFKSVLTTLDNHSLHLAPGLHEKLGRQIAGARVARRRARDTYLCDTACVIFIWLAWIEHTSVSWISLLGARVPVAHEIPMDRTPGIQRARFCRFVLIITLVGLVTRLLSMRRTTCNCTQESSRRSGRIFSKLDRHVFDIQFEIIQSWLITAHIFQTIKDGTTEHWQYN